MIEDRLAEDILDNKLDRDAVIKLSVKDDKLEFENIAENKKETLATESME